MASSYSLMVATIFFSLFLFHPWQAEGCKHPKDCSQIHVQVQSNQTLVQSNQTLVQRFCGDAALFNYSKFCLKVLSDGRAASATNATALADVVLRVAIADARASRKRILALIKRGSYKGEDYVYAKGCLRKLRTVVHWFQRAYREIGIRRAVNNAAGLIAIEMDDAQKKIPVTARDIIAVYEKQKRLVTMAAVALRLQFEI